MHTHDQIEEATGTDREELIRLDAEIHELLRQRTEIAKRSGVIGFDFDDVTFSVICITEDGNNTGLHQIIYTEDEDFFNFPEDKTEEERKFATTHLRDLIAMGLKGAISQNFSALLQESNIRHVKAKDRLGMVLKPEEAEYLENIEMREAMMGSGHNGGGDIAAMLARVLQS